MPYFNYHAKAIKLIKEGHLTDVIFIQKWNLISPAMVLFFDNYRPMPIRKNKWHLYEQYIDLDIPQNM